MKYLFSSDSLNILESLSFTQTLYAFDFDGTLAPIVQDPNNAKMKPEVERLFVKLSQSVPTAILSGRSLSDLRARLPKLESTLLIGNHGLEGIPRTKPVPDLGNECLAWKEQIQTKIVPLADDPGLVVEDKGLSLALHYRKSRKKKLTRNVLLSSVVNLTPPPRVVGGKLVLNLVPQGGPHKGLALKRLLADGKAPCSLYIGDDITDEDVFSLSDPQIISVRVGERRCSEAKYFIRNQSEITRLLSLLLEFHGIKS